MGRKIGGEELCDCLEMSMARSSRRSAPEVWVSGGGGVEFGREEQEAHFAVSLPIFLTRVDCGLPGNIQSNL